MAVGIILEKIHVFFVEIAEFGVFFAFLFMICVSNYKMPFASLGYVSVIVLLQAVLIQLN